MCELFHLNRERIFVVQSLKKAFMVFIFGGTQVVPANSL